MRTKRSINGLLLLDKPQGISSQKAVFKVKHLFQAEKAGHTGSLDPLATGMLPICLGEATKFSHYLLNAKKTYYVVGQLGVRTDTGDAEGQVIAEVPVNDYMLEQLDQKLKKFLGVIQQIPPMYSAIKFQGQPLYKLARKGQTIERAPREVTIYTLQRMPIDNTTQFALEVTCSKGTYIRTLVEDLGAALGCGAHVTVLRRLQVDNILPAQMHTLPSIEALAQSNDLLKLDERLLPVNTLVSHLPKVVLEEEPARRVLSGIPVQMAEKLPEGLVQLMDINGIFLGVGEVQIAGIIKSKRMMRLLSVARPVKIAP